MSGVPEIASSSRAWRSDPVPSGVRSRKAPSCLQFSGSLALGAVSHRVRSLTTLRPPCRRCANSRFPLTCSSHPSACAKTRPWADPPALLPSAQAVCTVRTGVPRPPGAGSSRPCCALLECLVHGTQECSQMAPSFGVHRQQKRTGMGIVRITGTVFRNLLLPPYHFMGVFSCRSMFLYDGSFHG